MSKLLLIEDDKILGDSLQECLQNEGFEVDLANSLERGREHLKNSYDLLILDWMLPDGQGIELLRELAGQKSTPPVIMLTARSDLIDRVLGLEMGASDYVTKPFETRELVARIRVQLRKKASGEKDQEETESDSTISSGGISMNVNQMEVSYQGEIVQLTRMEFALLKLFIERPGQVFSRDEILDSVWGMKYPTTRTVDMHVRQPRQKFSAELFETVHGTGYRFRPEG